ncbi:hypothetical protein FM109_15565 [Vibrio casei]|nr:hypothetical protein FM109_15565 [Vibrio casei]
MLLKLARVKCKKPLFSIVELSFEQKYSKKTSIYYESHLTVI